MPGGLRVPTQKPGKSPNKPNTTPHIRVMSCHTDATCSRACHTDATRHHSYTRVELEDFEQERFMTIIERIAYVRQVWELMLPGKAAPDPATLARWCAEYSADGMEFAKGRTSIKSHLYPDKHAEELYDYCGGILRNERRALQREDFMIVTGPVKKRKKGRSIKALTAQALAQKDAASCAVQQAVDRTKSAPAKVPAPAKPPAPTPAVSVAPVEVPIAAAIEARLNAKYLFCHGRSGLWENVLVAAKDRTESAVGQIDRNDWRCRSCPWR